MRRGEELLPRCHGIIFIKKEDRIETSKEPETVPSASGMSDIAACPLSPIADGPSTLQSPSPLPPPLRVTLLACTLNASPWMPAVVLNYCTFQGTAHKMENAFFHFCSYLLFMYYFYEKYFKPTRVQYYTTDCWLPRLTSLALQTNWTYEHSLGMELIDM